MTTENRFAHLLVAPKVKVGDKYTEKCSRKYRDGRGEQTETFTLLCEVTAVTEHKMAFSVLDITDIVNPYENFSRVTRGEIMGFAFNRDIGTRYVMVA